MSQGTFGLDIAQNCVECTASTGHIQNKKISPTLSILGRLEVFGISIPPPEGFTLSLS